MTLSQLKELNCFEKEATKQGITLRDYLYDYQEQIEAHIILLKRERQKKQKLILIGMN